MIKGIKYTVLASAMLFAMNSFQVSYAEDDASKEEVKAPTVDLGSIEKNAAYALGVTIADDLKNNMKATSEKLGVTLDLAILKQGFVDAFDGNSKMTEDDIQKYMTDFSSLMNEKNKALQEKELAKLEQEKADNLKAGKEFLEKNAKVDGVKVTASGLQYKVNKEGTGTKVSSRNDQVSVIYTGKLIDGKVFDSNEGKEPISFPLDRVIPGWQEGLELMSVGAEYTLYIPSELGYRDQVMPGNVIPPNSTLIFDVKLVDVKKAESSEKKGEPKQE